MLRYTTTIIAITLAFVLMGGCPIEPDITVNIPGGRSEPGGSVNPPAAPSPAVAPNGLPDAHYDPNSPNLTPSDPNVASLSPGTITSSTELPTQPASPAQPVPSYDPGVQPASVPDTPPNGPQIDSAIAGTWLRESNYWDSNSGYSSTTFYVLRLNPDGSFVYTTQFGAYNGSTILTDPSAQPGQWSTANGQLTLNYNSGLVEHAGYFAQWQAGSFVMLMTPPNSRQTMWTWQG